jgi:adenylate kinase family enzyme
MTVVIYLIGKPGVGKYSIAKEIAKYDYIVCDNHLVNNPILSLLNIDRKTIIPESAWNAIGNIRTIVLEFMTHCTKNNYVMTNVLNDDNSDRALFKSVENMARHRNSIFVPVVLSISQDEHVKRITNADRSERYKSTDIADTLTTVSLLPIVHTNLLTLDVTQLSAKEAAQKILQFVWSIH